MATTNVILDALRSERDYQRRRWGLRQPDGTFTETKCSVADFVLYMQDYYSEARHAARLNIPASLESLRKVIGLGFACLEHCTVQDDRQYAGWPHTFDTVAECIRLSDHIMPLVLNPDYSNYLLKIAASLSDAALYAACFNEGNALMYIHRIIKIGMECFAQYDIEPRDQPVINARDGQPA
jgi:hypothetical protein